MSVPFSLLTGRRYTRDNALDRTYATFNANRNSNGQNSWQSGIGGTLLDGRNLSYSVNQGTAAPTVTAVAPAQTGRRPMARWVWDTTTTATSMTITGSSPAA